VKTLLLMRHARAADAARGEDDFQRMLTKDGRAMAVQTGQILKSSGIRVDRLIASAAMRTAETAALVAKALGEPAGSEAAGAAVDVILERRLYQASAQTFARAAGDYAMDDDSTVLVVGHNPGIGALICHWASEHLPVSPATLVGFCFDVDRWSDIRSSDQETPRVLIVIQDGMLLQADDSLRGPSKG